MNILFNKLNLNFLKDLFGTSLVKFLSIIAGFVISILISRKLGAEGIGTIATINRGSIILIIFATFGLRPVIIKKVSNNIKNSIYKSRLLFSSKIIVLLLLIFILFFSILLNQFFTVNELLVIYFPFIFSFIILESLSNINSFFLNGQGKVLQASFFERSLSQIITAIFLIVIIVLFESVDFNISLILFAYLFARIIEFLFSYSLIFQNFNFLFVRLKEIRLTIFELLKSGFDILIIRFAELGKNNLDVIILLNFVSLELIGIYSVATRLANITSFFLKSNSNAILHKISLHHKLNDRESIQKLIDSSTMTLTLIGIVQLFIIYLFGTYLLSIWGQDFVDGYNICLVVAFAQFIHLSSGASGATLVVTGHERILKKINIYFFIVWIILFTVFAANYGIFGAACANSLILIMIKINTVYINKKYLGLKIWF